LRLIKYAGRHLDVNTTIRNTDTIHYVLWDQDVTRYTACCILISSENNKIQITGISFLSIAPILSDVPLSLY
jgi:hypothetical protein